jgi:hypothetical protein
MSEPTGQPNARILIPLPESARVGTFTSETVWADDLGGGLFKVWNVPALAYNINIADIVRCRVTAGELPEVISVVERSGSKTLRLFFAEQCAQAQIEHILELALAPHPVRERIGARAWSLGFRNPADYELVLERLLPLASPTVFEIETGAQPDEPFSGPGAAG